MVTGDVHDDMKTWQPSSSSSSSSQASPRNDSQIRRVNQLWIWLVLELLATLVDLCMDPSFLTTLLTSKPHM
jgi:hypothetical protein